MVYLTILENGDGPKFGAATISNNWGDIRKMGLPQTSDTEICGSDRVLTWNH